MNTSKKNNNSQEVIKDHLKNKENKKLKQYRSELNFKVISKYDSALKQIYFHTPHCVIYRFNNLSQEWMKTDFQGSLAFYLRKKLTNYYNISDLLNMFSYSIILLNRNNPTCFSLGIMPNKALKTIIQDNCTGEQFVEMNVELKDNLIIVKNLLGEIYGLWVFNEFDRTKLFKSLEYCIFNDTDFLI